MSFNIIATPEFKRELKPLVKKYRSLKTEFTELISDLKKDPKMGTPVGMNCFKIRISIASKGKGKSGGARVITCVFITENTIYLLSIYDKADKDNIADKDLKERLKQIHL